MSSIILSLSLLPTASAFTGSTSPDGTYQWSNSTVTDDPDSPQSYPLDPLANLQLNYGVNGNLELDDDDETTFSLADPFLYYGTAYSEILVCSNGYISFDTSGGCDPSPDPLPDTDNALIVAPFWTDLDPPDGGSVHAFTSAQATVIHWEQVVQFELGDDGGSTGPMTFQILLNHADDTIYFAYGDMSPLTQWNIDRGPPIVGIQGPDQGGSSMARCRGTTSAQKHSKEVRTTSTAAASTPTTTVTASHSARTATTS